MHETPSHCTLDMSPILLVSLNSFRILYQCTSVGNTRVEVPCLKPPCTPSISIAPCSKFLGIAASAVNILVRSITSQHAVQGSLAAVATEAFLVICLCFAKHLLSMENFPTTSRAPRTIFICLD